jgi:hypothetical protein
MSYSILSGNKIAEEDKKQRICFLIWLSIKKNLADAAVIFHYYKQGK